MAGKTKERKTREDLQEQDERYVQKEEMRKVTRALISPPRSKRSWTISVKEYFASGELNDHSEKGNVGGGEMAIEVRGKEQQKASVTDAILRARETLDCQDGGGCCSWVAPPAKY